MATLRSCLGGNSVLTEQSGADRHTEEFREGRAEALKNALEIRKFEIELYWSRASYFWAIIAAAFAGFFALGERADTSDGFIVSCMGLSFSLAWYLVNRGSAFWQRNWEGHVDLLEDAEIGPLHKSIITRKSHKMLNPIAPYKFSPSRLNVMLSMFITCIWAVLALRTIHRIMEKNGGLTTVYIVGALTALVVVCVPILAGPLNGNRDRVLVIEKRRVEVEYHQPVPASVSIWLKVKAVGKQIAAWTKKVTR
jgi:hypothetical protein